MVVVGLDNLSRCWWLNDGSAIKMVIGTLVMFFFRKGGSLVSALYFRD